MSALWNPKKRSCPPPPFQSRKVANQNSQPCRSQFPLPERWVPVSSRSELCMQTQLNCTLSVPFHEDVMTSLKGKILVQVPCFLLCSTAWVWGAWVRIWVTYRHLSEKGSMLRCFNAIFQAVVVLVSSWGLTLRSQYIKLDVRLVSLVNHQVLNSCLSCWVASIMNWSVEILWVVTDENVQPGAFKSSACFLWGGQQGAQGLKPFPEGFLSC